MDEAGETCWFLNVKSKRTLFVKHFYTVGFTEAECWLHGHVSCRNSPTHADAKTKRNQVLLRTFVPFNSHLGLTDSSAVGHSQCACWQPHNWFGVWWGILDVERSFGCWNHIRVAERTFVERISLTDFKQKA